MRLGDGERGLHDLVERVVGHVAGDEQLRRRYVVQDQRLDARHVHAHLAVNAAALDAHDDAEVGREPRGVCRCRRRTSVVRPFSCEVDAVNGCTKTIAASKLDMESVSWNYFSSGSL